MADGAPIFIDNDIDQIISELVTYYETATGRTLQPAQVERLMLNAIAYRESLVRAGVQNAAEQMLVRFSSAPVLDFLGELVGVTRLPAATAEVDLEFILVSGHPGVTIPGGTRVASVDGLVVFEVPADVIVGAGITTVTVGGTCQTAGEAGNGYAIGDINNLIDPQAFIVSVSNIIVSAGGADAETDEQVRERIYLAPSQFTTAGSTGAYKFHALSANPAIIDVSVTSPTPGTVLILPLMEDGSITPQAVIDDVFAACNAETVRPLSDTVLVQTPTRIDYTLVVNLTLFDDADATTVQDAVTAALEAFITDKRQHLGQDIVATKIISVCHVDGVYELDLGAFTDIIVDELSFAFCTGFTVNIIGTTGG